MCDDSVPKELFASAAQDALRDLHQTPDDRTAPAHWPAATFSFLNRLSPILTTSRKTAGCPSP